MVPCEDHEPIKGFVSQTINLIYFCSCGARRKTFVIGGVN